MPFVIGAIGGALGVGALSGGVFAAGAAAGAAFASTFVGGVLVNLATSVALSALSAAIAGKPKAPPPVGLRTKHVMTGGVNPEGFILGRYATSGAFACPPLSHTGSGRLPNGYLTYVIELAGSPGHQLETLILNGEEVEIIDPAPEGDATRIFGNKIGGRFEGKAWIRYYDGTQTAADPFLLDRFPAPHVRPWSADMVGAGICYAVVTFYYDRELFQGWPQCRFVLTGCPLYDPRADSTAGGEGAQRWNDPATWAPSHNPAVQVYNVLRGVSLPGGWVWGGGISADDLPYAVWAEAMDRCDALVDDGDGGTEAAYRAGFEILADDEPFEVIDELLRGCAGAVAESGGVWSVRVGGPALPVLFITDDDILGDAPEEFTPFPALDEVYNGISGTYIDPETLWESRDAAPIYNAAWEAEDGDRRLMATVQLAAVPYPVQVTRLMTALIADHRRMVRHVITLPSDAFAIEALDVIAWTSAANGYDAKSFEVMEVRRDLRAGRVQVALREVDPDDYDVPAGLTRPTPPDLRPLRAAVQAVPGWSVAPFEIEDAEATARRPGILATWDAAEVADARGIRIAMRVQGDTGDGDEKPMQSVLPGAAIIEALAGVTYELRAQLVADRATEWTAWLAVTAPDVRLSLVDLAPDLSHLVTDAQERLDLAVPRVVDLSRQVDTVAQRLAEVSLRLHQTQGQVADAGLYLDPETGKARLEGFTRVDGVLTQLGLTLDAVQGQLTLFATQSDVSTAISEALLDPTQIPLIDDLVAQVTALEISLDTVEAAITLAATRIELEAEAARITTAEADIDALEAEIALRVEQATFDDLEARTSNVELELGAFDGAAFQLSLTDIRQLRAADEATAATLLGKMLADHQNALRLPADLAFVRQDFRALVDEDREAIAQVRTDLGTAFGNAEALIGQEAATRSAADEALATVSNALAARLDSAEAGIEGNAEATSVLQTRVTDAEDGLTAQASAIDALTTTVGDVSAEVTAQGAAIATQEGRAEASFVLRARAGGAAGEVEVVAASDPTGSAASEVVIRSDRFRFEGDLAEFLGDLRVTGALIASSTIEAENIVDRSIVVPDRFFTTQPVTLTTHTAMTTLGQLVVERKGKPVEIEINFTLDVPGGGNGFVLVEVVRGVTSVTSFAQASHSQGSATQVGFRATDFGIGTGSTTYTLRARLLDPALHPLSDNRPQRLTNIYFALTSFVR